MAGSWEQLAPAIQARIESQLTGGSPPAVFRSVAPINQDLPYVLVVNVGELEEQVFDDSAETTETEIDISVYTAKNIANADTVHTGIVEEVSAAVRRWTPTLTNWNASPIRLDDKPIVMQIDGDAVQTVLSFTVITERK